MGRLNRGPNGPVSGKFGSVIGSSWRGIYYIKGLQKKIKKARSPLQIAQQNKFAFAVNFLKPVKLLLDMGFSRINPGGATGYNMAISHTVQHCIKGADPNYEMDYASILFCTKGKLVIPENIKMETAGMHLKVSWDVKTGKYSSPDDALELLLYQHGTRELYIPPGTARNKGELVFELSQHYKGETMHVYMYLVTSSIFQAREWSDSVYLGEVTFRE
ncbi:DUF6266 family protein [Daejeonella lutea]|uniref:Uncharacterized protein n=1 Tax=Daejeonella lutea TaxID=572036 RepID=A0A1T5CUC1_9SPHI|nr:DUF6266 family protein [Daejeonella lutea]SKB62921.1 hypothetical protein SAMN05661099_1873 [Daejeonella lutea]